MPGKAIIFSAPSGSGKTTIVQQLIKHFPGLKFSISATTRDPRPTEMNGREYYFLSPEEFTSKVDQNAFLEWEEVYNGTCYGTLNGEVERIWQEGNDVIFDVDVKGGVNLKNKLGSNALAIFIRVPSIQMLKDRLISRGSETEESLNKRLEKAQYEMEFESKFDSVVINDKLEKAVSEAKNLVEQFLG